MAAAPPTPPTTPLPLRVAAFNGKTPSGGSTTSLPLRVAAFNGKTPSGGFHRRRLPAPAIAMSSAAGRTLHAEATADRTMECFLRLIEAFHTQAEPAFCGLGTLVNVLNALEVDPGEVWKGTWRWYSEEMLDCCVDLEEVAKVGLTFNEWICLARCQGLVVDDVHRASEELATVETFRATVRQCSIATDRALCVAYSRKVVGQSGDGHYSPIGGYHAESDRVLVLDVARFKHPPHWLPLPALFAAMEGIDKTTNQSRGWAVLSRGGEARTSCVRLTFGRGRLAAVRAYFRSRGEISTATACCTTSVDATSCDAAAVVEGETADEAATASVSPSEELWVAFRDLPPLAASLVAVDDGAANTAMEAGGCEISDCKQHTAAAAARSICAELVALPLYTTVQRFASGRRPLPVSLFTAVTLLLLLPEILTSKELEEAFSKEVLTLLREQDEALAAQLLQDVDAGHADGECEESGGWSTTLAGEIATVRQQLRLMADPTCGVLCSTQCCADT